MCDLCATHKFECNIEQNQYYGAILVQHLNLGAKYAKKIIYVQLKFAF